MKNENSYEVFEEIFFSVFNNSFEELYIACRDNPDWIRHIPKEYCQKLIKYLIEKISINQ